MKRIAAAFALTAIIFTPAATATGSPNSPEATLRTQPVFTAGLGASGGKGHPAAASPDVCYPKVSFPGWEGVSRGQ